VLWILVDETNNLLFDILCSTILIYSSLTPPMLTRAYKVRDSCRAECRKPYLEEVPNMLCHYLFTGFPHRLARGETNVGEAKRPVPSTRAVDPAAYRADFNA
jgi:hypothetical protein